MQQARRVSLSGRMVAGLTFDICTGSADSQGGENGFSWKFSELRVTEFYAVSCKNIQAVLQVVASSSDENSDIAILEDKKLYGYW